jgi:renalase
MSRIAIIGAGIAGLAAADRLQHQAEVVLFDKSWRAGGRITTRANSHSFDHGAQYFTARSSDFKAFLAPLIDQGLVAPWKARHIEIDRGQVISRSRWDEERPRFVAVPGMTQLGQSISAHLDIHYETRITKIQRFKNQWRLSSYDQTLGDFDWVILAIPQPQVFDLMPGCFTEMEPLRQARMLACYTLMLGFDDLPDLGFDAASVLDSDISWIAVNHNKPGRHPNPALLVHSSHGWAESHLELDRDAVLSHLITTTETALDRSLSTIRHRDLHRWLYADVDKPAGQPALVDFDNQLAAIGDWCLAGRVESAFLSGIALAESLHEPD